MLRIWLYQSKKRSNILQNLSVSIVDLIVENASATDLLRTCQQVGNMHIHSRIGIQPQVFQFQFICLESHSRTTQSNDTTVWIVLYLLYLFISITMPCDLSCAVRKFMRTIIIEC